MNFPKEWHVEGLYERNKPAHSPGEEVRADA